MKSMYAPVFPNLFNPPTTLGTFLKILLFRNHIDWILNKNKI